MFRIGTLIAAQEEEAGHHRICRRRLRDNANPLELPDTLVNKAAFTHILEELTKCLSPTKTSFGITPIVKLSACLRFFAVRMAQSTFSEVLSEVLDALEHNLCVKWITYPTEEESRATGHDFYRKFRLPGVVGCIDRTHINIVAPKDNKHLYYNRKGNYSLNATLICDSNMRIRFVDATHPGACHDSLVWNTSRYRSLMEENYLQKGLRVWLLGDAGYPLQPWLLTPYRTAESGSVEQKFNDMHAKCRNIIERTIGVLKSRWRCLHGARQLHYEPKKAVQIVNVCVALHNICISYKCEYANEVIVVTEHIVAPESSTDSITRDSFMVAAQTIRANIANSL